MVVPDSALAQARSMLEKAVRPVIFHDDDCDGTISFVICYQFCKEGMSVPVKRSPSVGPDFVRKVEEIGADLVIILDKPKVDPEFFQRVKTPILWIDHHEPQTEITKRFPNVFYLNPRIWDDADNRPTTYWSYRITQKNLWLAVVGSVADWHIPDYLEEFKKEYADLLPEKYAKVEDLYLDTQIATLIRVIQFNLKGQNGETRKSVLTLTRIESPYEILKQTSARGKFLWKKYEKLASSYDTMLSLARSSADSTKEQKILLYIYQDDSMTFTSELSNELLIRYPGRIIFIGRKHDDMIKASIRSKNMEIPTILDASLKGCEGYGGGHKNACGLVVAEKDWDKFYATFSAMVEERRPKQ